MAENKCGYQMHIFVTSFSTQHTPVWRCVCMVQPLRQPFSPKCTNRILEMHHQNPVVPPESGVHPQNPVCTYSVPMRPWLHSSHWSPISLVPQCNAGYTILISPPSHWSPSQTLSTLFLLVPHLIGPPMRPWLHSSHWSISLVPNATLVIQFSLIPHLIDPPMRPWLQFSLVRHLIGPPSVTPATQFSLVPRLIGCLGPPLQPFLLCSHCSPIPLVSQCNPFYFILIITRFKTSLAATLHNNRSDRQVPPLIGQ